MKLSIPMTVSSIAQMLDAEIIGDATIEIRHLNEIHKVRRGSLIFVDNEKYYSQAIYSSASAILIDKIVDCPPNKALIIVKDPFQVYNRLAQQFAPFRPLRVQISPTAKIGKSTILEHGVVVGDEVTIGENCIIRANTVIATGAEIGNNVVIHANTTISSDAFYFAKDADNRSYQRWHSIGRVVIEDHVEIGAGCTIDKGVSGDTRIGYGTKIDNHVHVGHGVEIGKHCLIAAQVGIAGKTIIQDYVTIYGQVGISQALVIGEGAVILAQTGVSKSLPGDKTYFGSPAAEARTYFREIAMLRGLPELLKKHGIKDDADKLQTEDHDH
jgi:UDP-3-O-[3-hydroxymyristoyl] glucosamine N-acyltransferase